VFVIVAGEVRVMKIKQMMIVSGLVLAVLIPGAHAVSARQQHPSPTRIVFVRSGDTLWNIAASYPGDRREVVYRIMQLNHLHEASLRSGQRLLLPLQ